MVGPRRRLILIDARLLVEDALSHMKLWDFEAIDWDEEEAPDSNLAHCLENGVDERIVDQVLGYEPVNVKMRLETAEIALVGPDLGGTMWTLLFDWSYKRGDWLRPVTGWKSEPEEIREWNRAKGHQR